MSRSKPPTNKHAQTEAKRVADAKLGSPPKNAGAKAKPLANTQEEAPPLGAKRKRPEGARETTTTIKRAITTSMEPSDKPKSKDFWAAWGGRGAADRPPRQQRAEGVEAKLPVP